MGQCLLRSGKPNCNRRRARLPAAAESPYWRDRCWCKAKWLICKSWLSGRWGTPVSKPISWKIGDSCLRAHLHLWVKAEVFYEEGEGNRTRRSREGVAKFSTCRGARSVPIRQVVVWCASSGLVMLASGPWRSVVQGQQIPQSCDAWGSGSVAFETSS